MAHAAIWLSMFNLVDGVATRQGLTAGLVTEANPVMAWLIRSWPTGAWLIKLGGVPLLAFWLGAAGRPAWARTALRLLTGLYGCVVALHLAGYLVYRA